MIFQRAATGAIDRRTFGRLLAIAGLWPGLARAHATPERRANPFLVYYGGRDDPAISRFDLVVLDGSVDPAALGHPGRAYLGYVNVGEVASYQPHYAEVEAEGLLQATNLAWPDSRYVDMRDPRWHRRVLDDLVPGLLEFGFDGVFLDTIDNAEHLESVGPRRYAGMVEGVAGIVDEMRSRFPDMPIMINRGYAALPLLAGRFDMLLGESVRARFDGRGGYAMQSEAEYLWQRDQMWAARGRDPNLQLFSLDYWDPSDEATVGWLLEKAWADGFTPYVSTPDLQRVLPT